MSRSRETPQGIEIAPLTLHIGGEIRGVDLARPLPPQQAKEVRFSNPISTASPTG